MNGVVSEIETFIRVNGDRFKLFYIKHNMRGEMLPFRKITQIEEKYGSLSNYIQHFIEKSKPSSIEVITKKPNGNSHGIHPTKATFELHTAPTIINQEQPSLQGLSGAEKIYSLETNLLNRELQKETSRADRYEGLYHELREKHFDLEKDHKLYKDKVELEREKERLKSENSLTSVIKEVKPELFGLLGTITQQGQGHQPLPTTLQGVENEKLTTVIQSLSELPEAMQNEAIELCIRYLNADAKARGSVLGVLRKHTEELNEQINHLLDA